MSSTRCVARSSAICSPERRVVLDRPLVGEPQKGSPVVAERIRDGSLRRLRPQRDRGDEVGRVLRHVLLHERRLPSRHPDHREGAIAQLRNDPVAHGVEVVDQVALGRARRHRRAAGRGSSTRRRHASRRCEIGPSHDGSPCSRRAGSRVVRIASDELDALGRAGGRCRSSPSRSCGACTPSTSPNRSRGRLRSPSPRRTRRRSRRRTGRC